MTSNTTYKFGQFVRAVCGKPARAVGGGTNSCLYRADDGTIAADEIRQNDTTIRSRECPTLREMENLLLVCARPVSKGDQ